MSAPLHTSMVNVGTSLSKKVACQLILNLLDYLKNYIKL